MTITTRVRSTTFPFGSGKVSGLDFLGRPFVDGPSDMGKIIGTQKTVSEGHPWHSRKRGSVGDIGGDFYTTKTYVVCKRKRVHAREKSTGAPANKDYFQAYQGPIYPVAPNQTAFPPVIESSNAALDSAGATAVARCKPTNSVADASTFLGELLKDGLPHLVGSATWKDRTHAVRSAINLARSMSDEFLNTVFGWKPLVKDVRDFAGAVARADAVLKQYERDAGRLVRRTYHFPTQTTRAPDLALAYGAAFYQPSYQLFVDPARYGVALRTSESVRRQWFSGAFTYHLPSGYDSRKAMEEHALYAKKILGIRLTPSTLWELTPWSWAIDWFSNTGDVISNISDWATEGLVMQYGYMMEHTINKYTYTREDASFKNKAIETPSLTLVRETKIRRRANPFGFGLTWNGLSPLQLAIAAALGLSRSR